MKSWELENEGGRDQAGYLCDMVDAIHQIFQPITIHHTRPSSLVGQHKSPNLHMVAYKPRQGCFLKISRLTFTWYLASHLLERSINHSSPIGRGT